MSPQALARLVALALVVLNPAARAQEAGDAELLASMDRQAQADGALAEMAIFCKLPQPELHAYARAVMGRFHARVAGVGLPFTATRYGDLVRQGRQSTHTLLRMVPSEGDGYERNCQEVRGKVAAVLREAPSP
jgi:hypothetical protein